MIVALVWLSGSVAIAAASSSSAIVNGRQLPGWELDRELALRISNGSYHGRVSEERREELRCESLYQLVLKELKLLWAGENQIRVDPAATVAAWQEVRDRFASDEQYREALGIKGITDAAFRRSIHRDAVAQAVDDAVAAEIESPSASEVEIFFELHREDYLGPETRHVVHLLVHVPPSATGEDWRKAEARASDLRTKAVAGDASLLGLAEAEAEDIPPRYRDQVGDIGFVHRGSLQPAVDAVVFEAEVGSVTEPVKTIYGYSILQIIDRRPPTQLELDQVRAGVERRMEADRLERRMAELEHDLLDGAVVEVSECHGRF